MEETIYTKSATTGNMEESCEKVKFWHVEGREHSTSKTSVTHCHTLTSERGYILFFSFRQFNVVDFANNVSADNPWIFMTSSREWDANKIFHE